MHKIRISTIVSNGDVEAAVEDCRKNRHGFRGVGFCFGHGSAELGREASWYAFQREALERANERGGMAVKEIKPDFGKRP